MSNQSASPLTWFDLGDGDTVAARLDVDYVRDEMRKQVISQTELARRAVRDDGTALSKQMVNDLLKGRRGASPETIRALAKALEVLPRKLLCDVRTASQSASASQGSAA